MKEIGREPAYPNKFANAEIRLEAKQTLHRLLCILCPAISYAACHDKRIARQEFGIDVKATQGGFRRVLVSPSKIIAIACRHLGRKSHRVDWLLKLAFRMIFFFVGSRT